MTSTFSTPEHLRGQFERAGPEKFKLKTQPTDPLLEDLQRLSNEETQLDVDPELTQSTDMTQPNDYRHELQLRDEQLRRDMLAQRELSDARMQGLDERIKAFIDVQAERDKRMEDISTRATKAAESAATVKSNYWAAVGVQLLAVAAIVVSAWLTNQSNVLAVVQSTLAAMQAGKDSSATIAPAVSPTVQPAPSSQLKPHSK